MKDQIEKIFNETLQVHKWECPVCGGEYESEDYEDGHSFAKRLYKEERVRYKVLKYMQGVLCYNCYTDPKIQNSSL